MAAAFCWAFFSLLLRQFCRHGDRFARALALGRAARGRLGRVAGGFVLRIFAIKRVHVFSSRGFAMRRKTLPSGVSSMAQHHLSDSTRLFGCALGSKKDEPAWSGPIECAKFARLALYTSLRLRAHCAQQFVARCCRRSVRCPPVAARSGAQKSLLQQRTVLSRRTADSRL